MAKYLFIESRDPFESSDVNYFAELVQGMAPRAEAVNLFLVQNGVLATRPGAKYNGPLKELLDAKVRILADSFALRERAIPNPMDGVEIADMERLVQLLLEPGTKAIWH